MSSIQRLRVLVNERLSAAAEEIFEAVQKTIAGYEEEILLSKREIRRQHRMLQTVFKPEIKINKLPDAEKIEDMFTKLSKTNHSWLSLFGTRTSPLTSSSTRRRRRRRGSVNRTGPPLWKRTSTD
ncbi:hypothetical protein INR49_032798 [Caranx melampygus]|nr:hypothetical protein INR49_032798 [Caranx melampygus]